MAPHDHQPDSAHQSGHQSKDGLEFNDKARKLLDHWVRHNDDHAHSYVQWAADFKKNELAEAAALLESAAELTMQINLALKQALAQIPLTR